MGHLLLYLMLVKSGSLAKVDKYLGSPQLQFYNLMKCYYYTFSVSIEFHQGIFAQRYACRYHKEINCPYLLANRNGWLFIYYIEMRIFVQHLFIFSALSIN